MRNLKNYSPKIFGLTLALLTLSLVGCKLAKEKNPEVSALKSSSTQMRDRLNKILYWQMADELGLKPGPERDMSIILEDIQRRREKALMERDVALADLRKLGASFAEKDAVAVLDRYQLALAYLSTLDDEEYRRLKIAMGAPKLARFYVLREEILDKLRGTLKETQASK